MKRILPFLLVPALAFADGPRPIGVSNVTRSGEEIATATLAFGAGRAGWTFDLVAMSGLADAGDDLAAWARTNVVATIGPNDSTYTWTAPAGFWDDASCLRFALVPKSGMPYDTRIEYVTCHLKGYWIDTGIRMGTKEDAWRLETDSSFAQTGWIGGNWLLQFNTALLSNPATKSHITISYNEEEPYWLHAYQDGNLLGSRGTHGNGAERYWGNQNPDQNVMVAIWTLGLQNGNHQTQYDCRGSLWTYRIWKNGELVRDFVPVVSNGVPRLFERVTGGMFATSGFDAYPDDRGPDVAGEPADSTSELLQVIRSDAPIFGGMPVVSGVLGGSATVSGALASFGGDAADCTLRVLVGTQPDLSDAVVAATGAPAGSGAFSLAVSGLDPATTYYAAVEATGGAGGTARTDAVSFATLGAWTISSASLSTSQRTATVAIDAVQGAGDATFALLFTSGQAEKASVVRSEGGTFALEWDSAADPGIAWDETYEWRIRVSSEFGGVAWTNVYTWEELSGWSSYCTFWDTADYVWTGRGETPAWSDTNNWELLPPATVGKGYPDYARNWNGEAWCGAVFTNGTVADVLLDGARGAGLLRVQGAGTHVTVRGAPGASLRIGTFDFGSQTGEALGSVFRLDGATATFLYDVPVGNGNALVLDNGSSVLMNGHSRNDYALWIGAKYQTMPGYCGRVEVLGGSALTNENYNGIALGGDGLLHVSNATVRADWYLHPNASTLGGRVRLEGPDARLEVAGVLRGFNGQYTGDREGVLEFCVPKGGWAAAPLQFVEDTRNRYAVPLGGSADAGVAYGGPNASPIRLRVAPDSPALLFGKTDTTLVSWAPGVNPARVVLDALPKPAKDAWLSAAAADAPYAWTEVASWTADTAMPLAMGARLVGSRGTLILVK
ncbi:MAG: hypothetical protein IJV65_05120 [Kiritimatiellae bacterium]|nr:hypothetical protein [Kiritimatiellia bacterium]